jgi:outer membrane protein TolC
MERRLMRSKLQLLQTAGLPATADLTIAVELALSTNLKQTPDIEELLETSPVLQAVVQRLENAEYNTAIAKAAFLPSVYLDLAKSWSQTQVKGENTSGEEASWSIGGSLSFDLFDGDRKRLNVKNALASETIQKLELQNSRRTTALTLEKAWDNLLDASDSIYAAQEQLQATTERSTIAAEQYANGLISFDNWIIIEDALISAQQQELNSKIDALVQEANWLNAKGGNLDEI